MPFGHFKFKKVFSLRPRRGFVWNEWRKEKEGVKYTFLCALNITCWALEAHQEKNPPPATTLPHCKNTFSRLPNFLDPYMTQTNKRPQKNPNGPNAMTNTAHVILFYFDFLKEETGMLLGGCATRLTQSPCLEHRLASTGPARTTSRVETTEPDEAFSKPRALFFPRGWNRYTQISHPPRRLLEPSGGTFLAPIIFESSSHHPTVFFSSSFSVCIFNEQPFLTIEHERIDSVMLIQSVQKCFLGYWFCFVSFQDSKILAIFTTGIIITVAF